MKSASQLSCLLLKKRFVPKMKDILETEDQVSHKDIVEYIKSGVKDEKILKEVPNAEQSIVDAQVLSGTFTHTWPPVTSEGCLKDTIMFVYIKVQIEGETAIVARTYGVDVSKEIKHTYNQLLRLEQTLASKYKSGIKVDTKVIEVAGLSQQVEIIKGEEILKEGSVIMIRVWSGQLMICDTCYIGSKGLINLTKFVGSNSSSVFFSFKDEEEPAEVLSKFRDKKQQEDEDELKEYEQQRKETMKEEHRPKVETLKKEKIKAICYNNQKEMPSKNALYINSDVKKYAILLPINGQLVPFHVAYIKNITTREGFFRINFNVPRETEEGTVYVKELSFHVRDSDRISRIENDWKEMKKKWNEEEKIRNIRGMKEEKLVLRKESVPILRSVCINPVLKGKRTEGVLEAHMNGFRFVSSGGNVELMYDNIQHAFFQNGDTETVILLHFHMDPPVIIQNRPISDIQFYNEIMDISLNIDRGDRYYSEAEEAREEEREKRIRAKYNHLYAEFLTKVKEKDIPVSFEVPFRELKFGGTIKRNTATLVPTVKCLINISDAPYKVIELDTIEVVVFERLSRSLTLKNFDMVVIFKDHHKPVLQISSVSKTDLDHIKKWLNKCEIKSYETVQSLNWINIMEAVNSDPVAFAEKGWSFLDADNTKSDSEESEEVFEPDEELEKELDAEDDLSTDLSSEEESSSSSEEEDDDGESWSDLEREAIKDDLVKDREEHEMIGRAQMMKQRQRVQQRRPSQQRSTTIQNFFKKTSTTPTTSSSSNSRLQPIKINKAFVPTKKPSNLGGIKRPFSSNYAGTKKP
ncbi:hypothetical protein ENUP19_0156G0023 [Entamoeba nuttalli]|uniref:FACT complex subunit n=2 Tax=Entamoeba nuttalli TaxID=412467 RepID=K2HPF8_ENTNP|nr:chromatin-specific transcription elongation factor, putative [Entamoeba nuttalli P19]EKE37760.1 chromatin-specific transcription elongation factor, putative [Entamoeba nuttalli P19]|eukprot:XP_008859918.1 chromatin-specific transcription elongation factor, putative [Entamoeba nuttalli P19]